ncbi:chaperone modulator CbpM [Larkinella bovis]|uniref:Chaperone modulator CbpM n=1 Tax=Larkinella bovis TaxID=683041 RepID=A0ABW0I9H8_9BACT
MLPEDVIRVEEYCLKYMIEETFVFSLEEYGLIELVVVEESKCIPLHQLQAIEKFSNLYYELNINLDGIDAISHLLQKIETMQVEIKQLKNQLSLYESPS